MAFEIQCIGRVTHYYNRLGVVVIQLTDRLALGDWVLFYGNKTNFVQPIQSMQIDHQPIAEAMPDEVIAVQVYDRVREGDYVYPYRPAEPS